MSSLANTNCNCHGHPVGRLLGWWSIDEGSREEQARLYSAETSGSVFSHHCLTPLYTIYSFYVIVVSFPCVPALNLSASSLLLEPGLDG